MNKESYEAVIGLEVHAQLLTKTKAYSSDIAEYGGDPNTHVSVVTWGIRHFAGIQQANR